MSDSAKTKRAANVPVEDAKPNAALVPEPAPRFPKKYIVVGETRVLGHGPGETFTTTLSHSQEFLIEGGHIQQVEDEG